MESLRHQDKEMAVLEEYAALAQPHIEASNGRMVLLPADPETYPAQQLDCHLVEGDPQHAAIVELVASQASEEFPSYVRHLETAESQVIVRNAGETLKRGHNVILLTNHADTIDVALADAGFYAALDNNNYTARTGIVISKMISRIGYVLNPSDPNTVAVPAVDALKLICDDILLSFPRTPSMQKSKVFEFIPDHIDRHNRKIRRTITERQESEEGYLLAVAGSGSKDKPSPNDPNTYVQGELSKGTIGFMKQKDTYVLPTIAWLKPGEYIIKADEVLRAVTTDEEAHQVMRDLGSMLSDALVDRHFMYAQDIPRSIGSTALGS